MQDIFSGHIVFSLAAAFTGGLLTSFTPCVYPMIPITFGYIGARSGDSRARSFTLSLVYVLGVSTTYSALGAVAALTGKVFGQFSTSPVTLFIVANVCIILGLSMFDLFSINLSFLQPRKDLRNNKRIFLSAFTVGIITGLAAAPCTAPALGVILAFIAKSGNVFYGVTHLFAFSLGMGALLLLVGSFSGALAKLPKSGPWMVRVKVAMGLVMIVAGEYFLVKTGLSI